MFNGRSFCSLEYPSFKNSIENLITAVKKVETDYTKIIGDSALYKMFLYETDKQEEKSRKIIKAIFNMLHI